MRAHRIKAAAGAAALQLLILAAIISGLAVDLPQAAKEGLKLIDLAREEAPPPPEPPQPPPRSRESAPEDEAAPPNLRSVPTPVVAPPPVIPPIIPPPLTAAPVAGIGSDPTAGASDTPGPGTGAGGEGDGRGGGGSGGDGGDGGLGSETPPRRIGGVIRGSDYPRRALNAGIGGTVSVRYTVAVNGRVVGCTVEKSSGSAELDANTCRLIEKRFRYLPARDADGRKVPSVIVEDHSWVSRLVPAPPRN